MDTDSDRAQFNRRVLVIDDQPSIHEDFKKILVGEAKPVDLDEMEAKVFGIRAPEPRRIRFEVDGAYQGAEAIEKIRCARAERRPYALVFVDVRMPPGLDGVETLAMIFEEDQDIQAVLCTAYSDWTWSAIAERVDNEGRFLILKKPFDAAEVRQMAAAMTMKWSEQAALHAAYRRQELLHAATRLLVRASSPAACASALVELIANTLDWPFVALWSNSNHNALQCLGCFANGTHSEATELCTSTSSLEDSARVLPKEPLSASTFHALPLPERDDRARVAANAGLHGVLLVPIRGEDRNLGVLEMWRASTTAPDRGELALVEELCSRLGHFLDRAHILVTLAQREASLQALLMALPDIVFHVGRDGRTLAPLPGQEGLLPDGVAFASLLDVVPSHEHARLLETLVRAMDTGSVQQFSFTPGKDGRRYDARIAPMLETSAIVVLRDVRHH